MASEDLDAMSNYNEEIVERKTEKKDKKRVLIRQKKQKSFFYNITGIFKIIQ